MRSSQSSDSGLRPGVTAATGPAWSGSFDASSRRSTRGLTMAPVQKNTPLNWACTSPVFPDSDRGTTEGAGSHS